MNAMKDDVKNHNALQCDSFPENAISVEDFGERLPMRCYSPVRKNGTAFHSSDSISGT